MCLINGGLFCAVIVLLSYILEDQLIQNNQRNLSGHLAVIINEFDFNLLEKFGHNLIIAIKAVSSKTDHRCCTLKSCTYCAAFKPTPGVLI